jgi:8-oxo-dGTP pyrophosphatase MutT (NUDIX family)
VSVIVDVMNRAPSLYHVDRLELSFTPKPWAFAIEHREEIDKFFAKLQREKPAIWNGRVLLLHTHVIESGVFRGAYLETDYASFAAWRSWGRPPAAVQDCFAAAAIRSADGAFLLGVMGAHTLSGGQVYFPCGTPELGDIAGDQVDLEFSMRRELKEETGFDADEFTKQPGWTTVFDGALTAQIKTFLSSENAKTLRARALDHLAGEGQPELADIRLVRSVADFDLMMPGFVTAFLARQFGGR